MIHVLRFLLFLFLGVALCPVPASAEDGGKGYDLSLGAGVRVSTSEYKDEDAKVSPVPIINYEGEYLFVRGLTAGVHLYRDEANELSVTASYLSKSFDASESDDWGMQRLDDRDSTMMAGLAYALRGVWGEAELSLSADVLDTNNGFVADGSYAYPFKLSFFKFKPSVGVEWTSESYNDYYYGVSGEEAARSGMREYEAGSSFSPYAGLGVKIGLTDNFDLAANAKAKMLSEEITDSSMVDRDVTYSFGLGLSYSF